MNEANHLIEFLFYSIVIGFCAQHWKYLSNIINNSQTKKKKTEQTSNEQKWNIWNTPLNQKLKEKYRKQHSIRSITSGVRVQFR